MTDLTNILASAITQPSTGIAVASSTGAVALVAYWLFRKDDGKAVSRATKITTVILVIVAVSSTSLMWSRSSMILSNKIAILSSDKGYKHWGITDRDWSCELGRNIWEKYGLEARRPEIVQSATTSPDSAILVGSTYMEGLGATAVDTGEARRYFEMGLKGGSARAYNAMGYYHEAALLDEKQALNYYLQGAESGSGVAAHNLGKTYRDGRASLEPSAELAAKWFQRTADLGCPNGKLSLARLYIAGEVGEGRRKIQFPKDLSKARILLEQAADDNVPAAATDLGNLFVEENDDERALPWLLRGHKMGDKNAAGLIAELEMRRDDNDAALNWAKVGANAGDPRSAYFAGAILANMKDYDAAKTWLMRAERDGVEQALPLLGRIAEHDNNPELAKSYYERAAASGSAFAKSRLKQMRTLPTS